ncbi:MAG: hypothetical protein R6U40_01785 [Desulfobacterales bacterium]
MSGIDMNENHLIALFKIGRKDHMAELIREGHVFMNPLSYFAIREGEPRRSDPDEGVGFCQNAEGATLRVQKQGKWCNMGTLTGGIRVRNESLAAANLYCLHARTRRDVGAVFELNLLNYGDSYVLFLDADEFFQRLDEAVGEAGQELSYRLVEYVDRNSYTGPMGVFRKFSEYASDCEFRVVALPGTGQPLSLRLGNLSDIAIMGMTSERLRLDPKG